MKLKLFFNQYKVLILGFLAAIFLPIYELVSAGEVSNKALILAAATAALTWISRNFRGQWMTIIGLVGSSLITAFTEGEINLRAVVLQIMLQVIGIVMPSAKSRGYEHTDTIIQAKREGEKITPTVIPPPPNNL